MIMLVDTIAIIYNIFNQKLLHMYISNLKMQSQNCGCNYLPRANLDLHSERHRSAIKQVMIILKSSEQFDMISSTVALVNVHTLNMLGACNRARLISYIKKFLSKGDEQLISSVGVVAVMLNCISSPLARPVENVNSCLVTSYDDINLGQYWLRK